MWKAGKTVLPTTNIGSPGNGNINGVKGLFSFVTLHVVDKSSIIKVNFNILQKYKLCV